MNMSRLCVIFGNYSAFSAQQLLLAWFLEPYLCMCKPDIGKKSREPQYKSLEPFFWVFLALSSTPYQVWQPQPPELQSVLLSSTRWLHSPRVLLCWRCLGRKSSAHGAHPLLLYSEGSLSVPSDVQFLSCRQQKDKLVPGILHDQEQKSYFARGSQVRKHPVPTLVRSSQEFWVPLGEGLSLVLALWLSLPILPECGCSRASNHSHVPEFEVVPWFTITLTVKLVRSSLRWVSWVGVPTGGHHELYKKGFL